ncbi:MAG: right-handed parallel beta-helix repeat-containing protein [Cyclobacteriaceae bacterium]
MKHFLLTMLLVAAVQISFSQNILIADNNAGAPTGSHVYSTLQDAIDASTSGDIIHVIPSPTSYGSVTISAAKAGISIFGIGIKPDKDGPAVSVLSDILIYASDVRISGLTVTNVIDIGTTNNTLSNVVIENTNVYRIDSSVFASFFGSNILIRNCYVGLTTYSGAVINLSNRISNCVITNCIIGGYTSTTGYGSVTAYNGTIIKNNIFFGNGDASRNAFYSIENCTVSNNIFFGRQPRHYSTMKNVTFNNNVSVGPEDNSLPPITTDGVTGNNNFTDLVDPTLVFDNPDIVISNSWDLNWEPLLSATNAPELFDSGTDGTNIGPTGSTIPWDPTGVPLPLIQSVISSEVIKQGDNMDVTIKARGN